MEFILHNCANQRCLLQMYIVNVYSVLNLHYYHLSTYITYSLTLCTAKFNQKSLCVPLYVSFNIKLIIIRIVEIRRWVGNEKKKKVCNVQLVSCCVINETNRKFHITPNHSRRSMHNEMEKVFQIKPHRNID